MLHLSQLRNASTKGFQNMKNTIYRAVMCALLAVSAGFATTTYTQSVSSVTSVTIPGTTHNLGCLRYSVLVYDSNGVRQPATAFTATRNASTFDATITFATFFTGTVKLQGCFNLTSASSDFQVTDSAGEITVCSACTDSAPADRKYSSQSYAETSVVNFIGNGDNASATVWVYLDSVSGHLIFGVSAASGIGSATAGGRVAYNVTGFPDGSVPLATVAYSSSGFGAVTDYRSFN
jgi:hypothetical protein